MSRETNSLLLRYNINKFWSSSLHINKLQYINKLYENLLSFVLSHSFLHVLKIQYSLSFINIYIFHFKYDRFNFFYKYLKIKKEFLSKLESRIRYGLISKNNAFSRKINTKHKYFFKIMLLSIKKILLSVKYQLLVHNYYIFSIKNTKSFIFENKFISKFKNSFSWNYKLKYINQIIKLKVISLFCSLLIYLYTCKRVKINLKSVTNKMGGISYFPFKFKQKRNSVFIEKLFIIFLSFIFTKSYILNTYIDLIVRKTKNKKHIKSLVLFFSNLKIIFNKQFVPLLGLKFKIAGRLDGKLRKARYSYKLGSLRLLSLSLNIDYSCYSVFTQYGCFSLKLWLGNKLTIS